jgi:hypothetical protein
MRTVTLIVICSVAPLSGCHLYENILHNAINEPKQYCDEVKVEKQLKKEAKAAFGEVKRQYPYRCFGDDFYEGFIEGYSDYLDIGGRAEMPAMPPLRYRSAKYLNAEGHAQIRDYFLGFKYGLDVALATGCRPFYTVPILVAEQKELPALDIQVLPPPPSEYAPIPKPGTKAGDTEPNILLPNPLVPGLGNPVTNPETPKNTVPIPSPLPKIPDPKAIDPKGPGKSAQRNSSSPIQTVGAVMIPDPTPMTLPSIPSAKDAFFEPTPTRSPIFNTPDAREPIR